MRTFLKTIAFLFMAQQINAQCTVDAGDDIHICINQFGFDSTFLNPNVSNAVLPLENVEWSYFYQIPNSSITVNASEFLSDTSILNPFFTQMPFLNDIYISLIIQDSMGNICSDSVRVSYSLFNFFPDDFIAIQQGDTAQIHAAAESGFPPYNFNWIPTNNMSDSTNGSPNVWPEQTQQYQATISDSFNCEYTLPAWTVQVLPTSIINLTENKLKIYPNPTSDVLNFKFDNNVQNSSIKVYNMDGKIVVNKFIENNSIDLSNLSNGLYTFQLFNKKNEVISYGKINKK